MPIPRGECRLSSLRKSEDVEVGKKTERGGRKLNRLNNISSNEPCYYQDTLTADKGTWKDLSWERINTSH